MRRPRNRQQLSDCIDMLQRAISAFDRRYSRKILFFNELCYYDHLQKFSLRPADRHEKPTRVEEILNKLEPYIPLSLTEENFNLFLCAAEETEYSADDLPMYFTHKARIDFVSTLRRANNPERREWLLNVCDAIREIKEELENVRIGF